VVTRSRGEGVGPRDLRGNLEAPVHAVSRPRTATEIDYAALPGLVRHCLVDLDQYGWA